MLWKGRRESTNVDDRRGMSGGGIAAGGGVVGLIIYLIYSFLGGSGDAPQIPQLNPGAQTEMSPEEKAKDDERASFVKVILGSTEDVWHQLLNQYRDPTLVMFRDGVESACGMTSSAAGPFYCPGDEKVYIDLAFYEDMQNKLNAPGDFAMAYVIAHEVGHHVQKILGTSDKMESIRQQVSETEYNRYSVMLELQADFFAGVWAHYAQKTKDFVQPGDIEEALNAANQIGDDNLQKKMQGRVVPDAFTHGTSAQRVYWFKKGFETGDIRQGDTFNDPSLQ